MTGKEPACCGWGGRSQGNPKGVRGVLKGGGGCPALFQTPSWGISCSPTPSSCRPRSSAEPCCTNILLWLDWGGPRRAPPRWGPAGSAWPLPPQWDTRVWLWEPQTPQAHPRSHPILVGEGVPSLPCPLPLPRATSPSPTPVQTSALNWSQFPRGAAGGLGAGEGHLLPAQTPQDPALGEPVGAALRPPAAGRPQHHGSAAGTGGWGGVPGRGPATATRR